MLIENPGQGGSLNHLGVEVEDTDTVDAEQTRLAEAGLASVDERGTTCCYAKQDKFWVEGTPNGEQWEVYTVLADSPDFGVDDQRRMLHGRSRRARRGDPGRCLLLRPVRSLRESPFAAVGQHPSSRLVCRQTAGRRPVPRSRPDRGLGGRQGAKGAR